MRRDLQIRIAVVMGAIALLAGLFGRFASSDFASGIAIGAWISAMVLLTTWSVTGRQGRVSADD